VGGRFERREGPDVLLDALVNLTDLPHRLRGGDDRSADRSLAGVRLALSGSSACTGRPTRDGCSRFDVFVLSSHTEARRSCCSSDGAGVPIVTARRWFPDVVFFGGSGARASRRPSRACRSDSRVLPRPWRGVRARETRARRLLTNFAVAAASAGTTRSTAGDHQGSAAYPRRTTRLTSPGRSADPGRRSGDRAAGIKLLLQREMPDMQIVAEASDGGSVRLAAAEADVAILIWRCRPERLDAAREIRRHVPLTKTILLTDMRRPARDGGAARSINGYVVKTQSPRELAQAIQESSARRRLCESRGIQGGGRRFFAAAQSPPGASRGSGSRPRRQVLQLIAEERRPKRSRRSSCQRQDERSHRARVMHKLAFAPPRAGALRDSRRSRESVRSRRLRRRFGCGVVSARRSLTLHNPAALWLRCRPCRSIRRYRVVRSTPAIRRPSTGSRRSRPGRHRSEIPLAIEARFRACDRDRLISTWSMRAITALRPGHAQFELQYLSWYSAERGTCRRPPGSPASTAPPCTA